MIVKKEKLENSEQELWRDYLFLTQEMAKFLDKQDIDLFLEIAEQRERLQTIIEKSTKNNGLPPCQSILDEVSMINASMKNKLQYYLNDVQKRHEVSRAYDGSTSSSVGNSMDRES